VTMTIGQLLVNGVLPEALVDYNRVLDKRGINDLLRRVAQDYPEQYREVSHALSKVGWRAAQETGGYSFGMRHLRPAKAALAIRQRLRGQIQQLVDDDTLGGQPAGLPGRVRVPRQQDEPRSPSAAATSCTPTTATRSSPCPSSAATPRACRPAEYWAGSYGARKGVIDLKFATQTPASCPSSSTRPRTASSSPASTPTTTASPTAPSAACPSTPTTRTTRGRCSPPTPARTQRDTVLTPKVLKHLHSSATPRILVRSPGRRRHPTAACTPATSASASTARSPAAARCPA
jgi:hypothetical protein